MQVIKTGFDRLRLQDELQRIYIMGMCGVKLTSAQDRLFILAHVSFCGSRLAALRAEPHS